MKTVKEIYSDAKKRLCDAGIENPAFDAACILEKHTGLDRNQLRLSGDTAASCDMAGLWADIERRVRREPLQYILGVWGFYGLDFFVGEGVLIPRPDTEILCETAVNFLKGRNNSKLIELCAGSGCLSTAVAKNVENCSLFCVEISNDAIFYLEKNLKHHGLFENTEIIKADMLAEETARLLPFGVDAIVCNPPYIKSGDIAALQPEVAQFEPRLALDGGGDGLIFYRAAKNYLPLLSPGGMAAFEVGAGQADEVAALLKSFGLGGVFVKKDYGGINRVAGGFKI
jgi:release factor glutamine methyltransferase